MTKCPACVIIQSEREREVNKMAKSRTQGWYTFTDGYRCWFAGLSAQEKKVEIYKHGKVVKFEPTN